MVETIFRVIIILVIIVIVIAVLGSTSIAYNVSFSNFKALFISFMQVVCYLIPFKKLLPIFVCIVAFVVFKISVTLIKTVWDIFPLRG